MSQLMHHDDAGPERCVHCGAKAVGPCARCEAPICGDCCVLTEGGTKPYAVCLGCHERGTGSLRRGWLAVIGWLLAPILILAAALAAIALLFGR